MPSEDYSKMTPGEKAAYTRRRNKAAAKQTQSRDALLDSTKPGAKSMSLDDWRSIIDGLESSEEAMTGVARLESAVLVLDVAGTQVRCLFDGSEWRVEVE